MERSSQHSYNTETGCTLITGGAGFIGTNLAHRLLSSGNEVIIFDNLSRPGVERNYEWLKHQHGSRVHLWLHDTRNYQAVREAVALSSQIFHLAAQVSVMTSLIDPFFDFEVNLRGTLNVLEAARNCSNPPSIVFTSTNKVFGALKDIIVDAEETRYRPANPEVAQHGIGEGRHLAFHSPYGCSKGGADQYVLDYARCFDLPTVVFRMSCIYGPHQMGTEDQGWVTHLLLQAMKDEQIDIYGDGKQVRDVLFVEDLVDALLLAQQNCRGLAGNAFTIGGGPSNSISHLELLSLIESVCKTKPQATFLDWRTGAQRYFVADTAQFQKATGWEPKVTVEEGVQRLYHWLTRVQFSHFPHESLSMASA